MARKMEAKIYRYSECGLDHVFIEGLEVVVDDAGEKVCSIPNLPSLHRAIAKSIVMQKSGLSGKELRFLRTEMGLSQAELGEVFRVTRVTVNRWEQNKGEIDSNAQVVIRLLAAERLGFTLEMSVEEMAKRSISSAETNPIRIDGKDPSNYRLIAA